MTNDMEFIWSVGEQMEYKVVMPPEGPITAHILKAGTWQRLGTISDLESRAQTSHNKTSTIANIARAFGAGVNAGMEKASPQGHSTYISSEGYDDLETTTVPRVSEVVGASRHMGAERKTYVDVRVWLEAGNTRQLASFIFHEGGKVELRDGANRWKAPLDQIPANVKDAFHGLIDRSGG